MLNKKKKPHNKKPNTPPKKKPKANKQTKAHKNNNNKNTKKAKKREHAWESHNDTMPDLFRCLVLSLLLAGIYFLPHFLNASLLSFSSWLPFINASKLMHQHEIYFLPALLAKLAEINDSLAGFFTPV